MQADEVYRLALGVLGDHEQAVVATAIAWAESGLDEEAIGDRGRAGEATSDGRHWGPSVGLWQVRSIIEDRWSGSERDAEALLLPEHNATAMRAISTGGSNWNPWSVYRDGSYQQHLAAVREAVGVSTVDIIRAVVADLEAQDVPVVLVDGWEDRGRPSAPALNPQCVVCHHTATHGYDYDYPSLGIVRDGRADLPGPLSEFGIGRHTGTVYVIASGKANHAGEGGWEGLVGNSTAWGIEAENDGIGEEWGPEMRRSYLLLVAALCRHSGFGAEMVCEHFEWSPYKIDRANYGEPDEFRSAVADVLAGGAPDEEEDELDDNERRALLFVDAFAQEIKREIFEPLGDGDHIEGMRRMKHVMYRDWQKTGGK